MFSSGRTKLRVLFYGILLLFFFQLITDFFQAIYAFGLLGTGIPVEMVSLLLMFSPLALLAFPRGLPGWPLVLLGCGVLACRASCTRRLFVARLMGTLGRRLHPDIVGLPGRLP